MNGLSLFAGIGGLDLAFEYAGGTVKAMCEKEPYCQKILKKHWPDVQLYDDIFNLRGEDIESRIDIIYGGPPCQPFSVAGRQRGQEDERHLWPEFSRLVGEIKPIWVVIENVSGIIRLAADDICKDLERLDYSVGIWNYEAASVGALHRRSRVFFVAHTRCKLHERCLQQRNSREKKDTGSAINTKYTGSTSNIVPNHDSERSQEQQQPLKKQTTLSDIRCDSWGKFESTMDRSLDGISTRMDRNRKLTKSLYPDAWLNGSWEDGIQRVATQIPNRVNRLKALGNAVVPAQAYPIFKIIMSM